MLAALRRSHRARVRAAWLGGLAAAAGVVAALIVFVPNTGSSSATPIDYSRAAKVVRTPPTVPLRARDRGLVLRTLDTFVRSAVLRRDLAASWPLTTADLRRTVSRRDWLAGDLPVAPYPARAFGTLGYTLRYSWPGTVGYDVMVVPRRGTRLGSVNYRCELRRRAARWLVQFCYADSTPHRDGFGDLNNARP